MVGSAFIALVLTSNLTAPRATRRTLRLDSPVRDLPYCTGAQARGLERLGIRSVRDLLLFLPFGWHEFGEAVPVAQLRVGQAATVAGTVVAVEAGITRRRNWKLTEAVVRDEQGSAIRVVWFNQPYLARELKVGDRVVLAGTVRASRGGRGLVMHNPQHEVVGRGRQGWVGALMPKYHLTKELSVRRVASWVALALPLADQLDDVVPPPTRERHRLLSVAEAVRRGHRPHSENDWLEAKRRMAFAELLEFQAAFWLARRRLDRERATPVPYRQEVIERFKAGLQFRLTLSQRRATWEIYQDLGREVPMNRLLDGDVGSGKTAVAAAAVAMVHASGLQSVVMAPTEVLARQHLERFRSYLEPSFPDLRVELLVSGLGAAERRRVRAAAASHQCSLLIGTHALIEEEVELAACGLAVVDEQHRFGTRQRELLRAKSRAGRPHFLCMSATPIPRSLALALYGEMSLSVLDEMPPGRTPVRTQVLGPKERGLAYQLVRDEVRRGHQAFVICPLVEESPSLEVKAATAEFEHLRSEVFPDLRLALVHGRMRDKDGVMESFREHRTDVLVATPVVEVGVDVPDATVVVVEGADRFGLAQLHQLRGRVGRGRHPGHCLLLADDPSPRSMERLRLVEEIQDGFRLAAEDMRLRGAGELLGQRQHGMSDLAMAALQQPELLSEIREELERLAAEDPELERWPSLRSAAERRLQVTSIS